MNVADDLRALTDEMIADDHDDPACACDACTRVRAREATRATAREAQVRGGLRPIAHELLGPGWLERRTVEPIETLAQRALADVFDQLERIGAEGRERCRPLYAFRPTDPAPSSTSDAPRQVTRTLPPVDRGELLELLRYAAEALKYAELHLSYLPANDNARALRHGDRVFVTVHEERQPATVVRPEDAENLVLVRWESGVLDTVPRADISEVAQ